MRAADTALLLALAVVLSESALARKGGGGHVGGAKVSGGHVGGKVYGGHASGGKVYGGHVGHGHSHFKGHHHHGHHHHGHHHGTTFVVGFGFAYPWSWYGYYPPPYYYPGYYYPQPVAYPAEPVTYVEQSAPAQTEPAGWWYYCETSRTYYPYVRECPNGWQRVPALPPPPN